LSSPDAMVASRSMKRREESRRECTHRDNR
jgi:hypothetical protein